MSLFRKSGILTTLLLIVGITAGCGGSGGGDSDQLSGEVNIAGSSTVYPVATAVSEEFQKEHPNVRVSISSTGSGGGFANFFCPGKTDLNNASRPIGDDEMKQCQKNGIQPIEFQVAIDAVTVVTNKDNPVDCMTTEELKQVWQADGADRWSDINPNWPDEEFELYGAASTSGTFDYFTEAILHKGGKASHRSDYSATEHDNTIVQGVSGSKHAMGYFGYAYYKQNKDKVKALGIDNGNGCVKPSLENAKSGKYKPLSRPLFTYAAESSLAKDHVRAFTKSFIERSGTELVSQIGYVPVTEDIVQENLDKLERVSP
jgi:phosphate transport system substrate-binding protein